jgi:Tfp pilus assembly protein PilF
MESLGPLYMQRGDLEKARSVLERASEMAPGNSGTHYQLAMIYTRLGMPDRAKQHTAEYQRLSKH